MHGKYDPRELVVITVTVPDNQDRAKVLDYLKEQGATFANYWLDEDLEFYQERVGGASTVFVFDRDGRRAGKFVGIMIKDFSYERDVEPLVQELLRTKP
jgi:hypothetical protein